MTQLAHPLHGLKRPKLPVPKLPWLVALRVSRLEGLVDAKSHEIHPRLVPSHVLEQGLGHTGSGSPLTFPEDFR